VLYGPRTLLTILEMKHGRLKSGNQ